MHHRPVSLVVQWQVPLDLFSPLPTPRGAQQQAWSCGLHAYMDMVTQRSEQITSRSGPGLTPPAYLHCGLCSCGSTARFVEFISWPAWTHPFTTRHQAFLSGLALCMKCGKDALATYMSQHAGKHGHLFQQRGQKARGAGGKGERSAEHDCGGQLLCPSNKNWPSLQYNHWQVQPLQCTKASSCLA